MRGGECAEVGVAVVMVGDYANVEVKGRFHKGDLWEGEHAEYRLADDRVEQRFAVVAVAQKALSPSSPWPTLAHSTYPQQHSLVAAAPLLRCPTRR